MEDTSAPVDATTTDSQPDNQTDVDTSSQDTDTTEDTGDTDSQDSQDSQDTDNTTTDDSSEETENTKDSTEKPKSKATERIRDLIKKVRDLESENTQLKKNQPEIQGVTEDGVEVDKLFNSAVEKAKNDLAQATTSKEIGVAQKALAKQAVIDFEFMKEPIWQEEAQVLVDRGMDPYTAAEMVGQKISYLRGATEKTIAKQVKADKALKDNAFTPSGQKPNTTGGFSQEEIAQMSTAEYEKNKSKILKQYGIRANL